MRMLSLPILLKKYKKMADNQAHKKSVSSYSFERDMEDTPVPAAEVLIDLKESARRRQKATTYKLRTSPRRKTPNSTFSESPKKAPALNHHNSSRRLDFSDDSSGATYNSVLGSSEEDEVDESGESSLPPVKRPKRASAKIQGSLLKALRPDQVMLHEVSSTLRNFLKLPKAHKWCYYEWFYSDIDQPLLEGENDFSRCLSEMFPELKTRSLSRVQWRHLRRLMGKPRRCSQTFFGEERALLEMRRQKVRQLQQQVHQGVITVEDFAQYKDLPDQVPALLVVGTHVTARLHSDREQESGFYTGRIEAVDIESHKYWVTFDRPGLGKHPVADTEIRSAEPPAVISISALESAQKTQWPPRDPQIRQKTPPRPLVPDAPSIHALFSPDTRSDPFLTASPARRKMLTDPVSSELSVPSSAAQMPEQMGGFPLDFLKQVTQLSKLLQFKQQRLKQLGDMNTEVEKMHARLRPIPPEFQHQYATVIIDLDDMNKQLNLRLESIRSHCEALGYAAEVGPTDMNVNEHAQKITRKCNSSLATSGSEVKDPGLLNLIARLTGLLLQVESLSESGNSLDLSSLTTSLGEVEKGVQPLNRKSFQDHVETPITLIQAGMNPIGTLHAFSRGTAPAGSRTSSQYHHYHPPS